MLFECVVWSYLEARAIAVVAYVIAILAITPMAAISPAVIARYAPAFAFAGGARRFREWRNVQRQWQVGDAIDRRKELLDFCRRLRVFWHIGSTRNADRNEPIAGVSPISEGPWLLKIGTILGFPAECGKI